jgi:hypothetical protein
MTTKDYLEIAQIGDTITYQHIDGFIITGMIGEKGTSGKTLYLWNNSRNGSMGHIDPTSRGYRFSWALESGMGGTVEISYSTATGNTYKYV